MGKRPRVCSAKKKSKLSKSSLLDQAAAAKDAGKNSRAEELLSEAAGRGSTGPVARAAAYELALLLSQLGRHEEADRWLLKLGFRYKLNPAILDGTSLCNGPVSHGLEGAVAAFDDVLPSSLLDGLCAAFNPTSSFWQEHCYPTPAFFSYNEPLSKGASGGAMLIREAAACLRKLAHSAFPSVVGKQQVTSAEWWAHLRPAGSGSGHQLHFDLDEAGLAALSDGAKPGHPLISCVIYLSGCPTCDSAEARMSPTLVTDQDLSDGSRAQNAWLCTPKKNRALLFNGNRLHGVVPTLLNAEHKSSNAEQRVTLMLGLWGDAPEPTCSEAPAFSGNGTALQLRPNMRYPHSDSEATWTSLLQKTACISDSAMQPRPAELRGPLTSVWSPVESKVECEAWPITHPGSVDFLGRWFLDEPPETLQEMAVNSTRQSCKKGIVEVEEVSMEELLRLRATAS